MNDQRSSGVIPIEVPSERLPEDLSALVAGLLAAEENVNAATAECVYRLAFLARAAHGRRVGSLDAMSVCAQAIGITRQTLQPFALIARCWTQEELRELLTRRDAHGRGLSSSHLVTLARIPRAARIRWIERALAESLDVRALRRKIHEEDGVDHRNVDDDRSRCTIRLSSREPGGRLARSIA